MGLGMQLTAWPDAFVDGLLARGHTVIRFDNRDIGLSSKLAAWGRPRLLLASMRRVLGLRVRASYTLADMAADTVGMLDALTIARVHLVGVSMGGMIGQIVAARYPERVASFTCIMSSSGARELPGPTRAARRALLSRPRDPHDVESIIDHYVKVFGVIGSPGFPSSAHMLRELYGRERSPLAPSARLGAAADGDRRIRRSEPIAGEHQGTDHHRSWECRPAGAGGRRARPGAKDSARASARHRQDGT